MRTENISRRPMSISIEDIHLHESGRIAQLSLGPISLPKAGPTLPKELNEILTQSTLSTPANDIRNIEMASISMYDARNANSVTRFCIGTLIEFNFKGTMALGCSIWRNSFFIIFITITDLMLLKPPLVEPELAPRNMQTISTTHVMCAQLPALSLAKPVVVNAVTTSNNELRKAYSMP